MSWRSHSYHLGSIWSRYPTAAGRVQPSTNDASRFPIMRDEHRVTCRGESSYDSRVYARVARNLLASQLASQSWSVWGTCVPGTWGRNR
jgi:hypothetical protein